jgi:putative addiction module antidote
MTTTKLSKIGNSTGVTLPRDLLAAAGMERGDTVSLQAEAGRIELKKVDDSHAQAMAIGRAFIARYRRTMAALAK